MTPAPRVFTIPASAPFLPTLISALVEGRLVADFPKAGDPLALASATLYLPTRRACRLARDVFLDVLKGEAAILPRIVALGDIDEDEIVFAETATSALADDALMLKEAITDSERNLLLAQLILKWAERLDPGEGAPLVAGNPATALALARDLARLIDDMITRKVPWEKLDGLVPDNVDQYWQATLHFLKVARELWPALLDARGMTDPAARRDALLVAEVARLQDHPGPVIAAGSTGSMPATATLLTAIASLPRGAVLLPGLDTELDEQSWQAIGGERDRDGRETAPGAAGHPQFAMQALLRQMKIDRGAVIILGEKPAYSRDAFVSEALRPAAVTEMWPQRLARADFSKHIDAAMANLSVIEAAHAEEEALAIAVVLREACEKLSFTAALVTPDRTLARRGLAGLARWNVPVDDSGGDSLTDTPAGVFARLAVEVALGQCEPVPLLALLKHSLLRLGAHASAHDRAIAGLERAILRGPRPGAGATGVTRAMAAFPQAREKLHPSDPRRALGDRDIEAAEKLAHKIAAALAPLENLDRRPASLADLAARHRNVLEQLSQDADGRFAAFAGSDGVLLAQVFDELNESDAAASLRLPPDEYADIFRTLLDGRIVRRPAAPASRVRILGPLEARLQQADLVVLGGLVEGVWPPETRNDAWLSRPMRRDLGLDLPERRIGLSAHDFAQALGAREVVLTRAAKREGAPTVPSRFLQRLAAVAGDERWQMAVKRGNRYLALARQLDQPAGKPAFIPRPEPKPPRDKRPSRLSVTEIEHWLRDPYTIYARHVLHLRPLEAVDTPPGARDRGTVIHEAIGDFTREFAAALPSDALEKLIAYGRQKFAPLEDFPEARAFWWPRFMRIAGWFVKREAARRANIISLHSEKRGALLIPAGGREFHLTAVADRIEQRADGSFAILDYKTGAPPTTPQVESGLAPQLTLEAAILHGGGFEGIPAGVSISALTYIRLSGGDPAGLDCEIEFKQGTPASQADHALKKLTAIITAFEDATTPYRSLAHPMWRNRYGDYDHLARVKEWSATSGEVGEDMP
jgi:ATP-dependent helicase/nuclease subunit B